MASLTDARVLQLAWGELFMQGTDEEKSSMTEQDVFHIPQGLRMLIDTVLGEGIDYINENLSEAVENGELQSGSDAYDAAMESVLRMSRMVAARMYRMGQHLAVKLPYGGLTPCPCTVLADDELEDFLKMAAMDKPELPDLKGNGFVIKQFDRNKKPEQG
jgi:hypothetical protein